MNHKDFKKYKNLLGDFQYSHVFYAINLDEIKDHFELQEWLIPNVYETWSYHTPDPEDEYQEEIAFLEKHAEEFFNEVKDK